MTPRPGREADLAPAVAALVHLCCAVPALLLFGTTGTFFLIIGTLMLVSGVQGGDVEIENALGMVALLAVDCGLTLGAPSMLAAAGGEGMIRLLGGQPSFLRWMVAWMATCLVGVGASVLFVLFFFVRGWIGGY